MQVSKVVTVADDDLQKSMLELTKHHTGHVQGPSIMVVVNNIV